MDADRFDALLRTLTSPASRRVTLGSLAAGALVALGLALDEAAVLGKKKGKKNKKGKKQCPAGKVRCGGRCKECCGDDHCLARFGPHLVFCKAGRCVECVDTIVGFAQCQFLWGADFPYCVDNRCVDGCRNGVLDGDESDVDCGGSCPQKCADGRGCFHDPDCQSGFCVDGTCRGCGDGLLNGDESDVDCGGSCPTPCADGQGCFDDTDCQSGDCANGQCAPEPTCTSDADCPGACQLCTGNAETRGTCFQPCNPGNQCIYVNGDFEGCCEGDATVVQYIDFSTGNLRRHCCPSSQTIDQCCQSLTPEPESCAQYTDVVVSP